MTRSHLPNTITLSNGKVLRPVIGEPKGPVLEKAKAEKKAYRHVSVLHPRLRGVENLHGKHYQPTQWLFVEDYQSREL